MVHLPEWVRAYSGEFLFLVGVGTLAGCGDVEKPGPPVEEVRPSETAPPAREPEPVRSPAGNTGYRKLAG